MEDTLIGQLAKEITEHPKLAVELLSAMSKVVRPWDESSVTTLEDGRGQNVVKSYKRITITGQQVAVITQNFPAWHIKVMGERPAGAPSIFNRKDAQIEAKVFADDLLGELGYILMEDEEE